MKSCRFLVLPCWLLLAAAVQAQPDLIAARFKQLDTNGDGKLSAEELKDHPVLQARLKGADKNADGFLTLEEVRAHLGQPASNAKDPAPAPATPRSDAVREGPRVLAPAAAGVGRMAPDAVLKDLDGRERKLKDLVGKNGLVVAFTNTTCPISQKYGPTLTSLEATLAARGVNVVFINPTANEKPEAMRAFVAARQLKGAYLHDRDGSFSKSIGATTTAEVFLLDRQRTIIYRGAIDDQYGLGYSLDAPKRTFLLDAVAALHLNRTADPAATTAPGCELDLASAKAIPTSVTYHNRISRIIQSNCIECHRSGGVGPFSLEKYEDVAAHAGMIRKVVEKGTMPPWFAAPPHEGKLSPWANDRTVSPADKTELLAWLKSERPRGDDADAPLPRTFADGWLIGKPDIIYQFAKPVAVKATGTMPYQNITIETKLTEDKWVKAVEVRPTAPAVVHHVLVFALPPIGTEDTNAVRGEAGEARRGFFAAYVPGQSTFSYPDNFARKLPKGTRLRFQMHYTPNGTATEDQTRIGLVFASRPPDFEVKVAGVVNARLSIPPGADNHPESASQRFPSDATVLGFLPHMHLRGKAFRYEMTPAGGKTETILDVPRYDFNWQLYYRLAEPRPLTVGTTVKATGWFDNSTNNPANPDATRTVHWGPQTTDEMMLGYVEYIVPVGSTSVMPADANIGLDSASIFKRVDADGDGKISRTEYDTFMQQFPRFRDKPEEAKRLFERLDADKDGVITPEEFKKLSLGG